MAYLDEDILYDNIEEKYKFAQGMARKAYSDVLDTICEMPRADVVPKSEVVNILDGLMKEAREIENHYEKSANETSDYDYARIEYRGCQMGALLVLFKIAELKKKYEVGNDG